MPLQQSAYAKQISVGLIEWSIDIHMCVCVCVCGTTYRSLKSLRMTCGLCAKSEVNGRDRSRLRYCASAIAWATRLSPPMTKTSLQRLKVSREQRAERYRCYASYVYVYVYIHTYIWLSLLLFISVALYQQGLVVDTCDDHQTHNVNINWCVLCVSVYLIWCLH